MCLVCIINAEESRLELEKKNDRKKIAKTDINCFENTSDHSDDRKNRNHEAFHYFAIGSMTNSHAMGLREINPISSQPALLYNWRLLFRSAGGMATIEKIDDMSKQLIPEIDVNNYPFEGVHGVLHLLTWADLQSLDDFEGGYERVSCEVQLYNGTIISAFAYQMNKMTMRLPHELPTERYLDIIAQGCLTHGVDISWIEFIRQHPCIPRKKPADFASFAMTTAAVPILSWEQISEHTGTIPEKREFDSSTDMTSDANDSSESIDNTVSLDKSTLWIVINNKVLEFRGDTNSFFPFGYFVKHGIGGTDFTVRFAKAFYEPKYTFNVTATRSFELCQEHRCWIEDQFACPPPALARSRWSMVGVVHTELLRAIGNGRVGKRVGDRSERILNLASDMAAGVNQFFVEGTSATLWIVADGSHVGQTLSLRKTASTAYIEPVRIRIKHLSLTNVLGTYLTLTPDIYTLHFCWDGNKWCQDTS